MGYLVAGYQKQRFLKPSSRSRKTFSRTCINLSTGIFYVKAISTTFGPMAKATKAAFRHISPFFIAANRSPKTSLPQPNF
jgi:hypothetical protein